MKSKKTSAFSAPLRLCGERYYYRFFQNQCVGWVTCCPRVVDRQESAWAAKLPTLPCLFKISERAANHAERGPSWQRDAVLGCAEEIALREIHAVLAQQFQ